MTNSAMFFASSHSARRQFIHYQDFSRVRSCSRSCRGWTRCFTAKQTNPYRSQKRFGNSRVRCQANDVQSPSAQITITKENDFDWMLGLALAGCAFEAYNGLAPMPTPAEDDVGQQSNPIPQSAPLHSVSSGGTHITYLDAEFLRTRMAGIIEVVIVKATDLPSADLFAPSDPYTTISIGGSYARSQTIENNNEPIWNYKAQLFVQNLQDQLLTVRVFDQDIGTFSDDFLGAGMRGLADLGDGHPKEIVIPLRGGKSKESSSITIQLRFESFAHNDGDGALLGDSTSRVIGVPSDAVLASPWRELCRTVIPPSSADDYLGLEPLAFLDNHEADTQAWVSWNVRKKRVVVAFRGTEQDRMKDVLTDLQLNPIELDAEGGVGQATTQGPLDSILKGLSALISRNNGGGTSASSSEKLNYNDKDDEDESPVWVHSGFFKAYKAVRPEILQLLDAIIMPTTALSDNRPDIDNQENKGDYRNSIQDNNNNNDGWSIFVTGHSLGGALSTLAAYELGTRRWKSAKRPKIVNYTYGSPRVGNRAFAGAFNKAVPNAWRIMNNNDAVTLVPRLLGYCHVGHLVRLTPEGEVLVEIEYDSFKKVGEGTDVVDIANAMVLGTIDNSSTLGGGGGAFPSSPSADQVAAVIKAEIEAMNNLLDGSAVVEHLEPSYLENLEKAIDSYFSTK